MKSNDPELTTPVVETPHFVVVRTDTSTLEKLPDEGDWTIGTGPDVSFKLDDPDIAAIHARVRRSGSDWVVSSMTSERPTFLNDRSLTEDQSLISGDVITVGEITLIFNLGTRHDVPREILGPVQLMHRLIEEVGRSVRNDRDLAVLVVNLGSDRVVEPGLLEDAVHRSVRIVDILGRCSDSELCVVMPDTGYTAPVPARRILDSLMPLAPRVRLGLVHCPWDGHDADSLITGAREAARNAGPAELSTVSTCLNPLKAGDNEILTVDPAMKRVLSLVKRLAGIDLPVLITGETGVGKELIAQALHHWSHRRDRPLVVLNCAAIPETLFESELFGHERGAFTGAIQSKPGRMEEATGGTLFLDEVGECSLSVQAKLLRAIETRRICRVGSVKERAINVRIIAATNRELMREVASDRFRKDLYYRLGAATVFVPPLRDRPLDVTVLARAFLEKACRESGRHPLEITPAVLRRLALHPWPGNIRELKNLIEYCAATVDSHSLEASHLPAHIARETAPWLVGTTDGKHDGTPDPTGSAFEPFDGRRFRSIRDEIGALERTRMIQALEAVDGIRVRAAQLLDMPLRTFMTKLKAYGIANPVLSEDRPGRGE